MKTQPVQTAHFVPRQTPCSGARLVWFLSLPGLLWAVVPNVQAAPRGGVPRIHATPGNREKALVRHGEKLFKEETFGGNGRTCSSCHSLNTGTLKPEEAQARFAAAAAQPSETSDDALFRPVDSDDGLGVAYQRLLTHATIRVPMDLPEHITLADAPEVRTVVLNRGIPSMIDVGLTSVLMHDGRAPDLETQALGAILGHAEAQRDPSLRQLQQIAEFERTLYSRSELARFAQGGPPPVLPEGTTPAEIRGKRHFQTGGLCHTCHSGPMLNETSREHPAGAGQRFENIFVSERNLIGNPLYTFLVRAADGTTNRVETPDPGLALVSSEPVVGMFGTGTMNFFRTPGLWNIRNTAPYFHDNSAKTLEEVLQHYMLYVPQLTPQDMEDIVAYLKLL